MTNNLDDAEFNAEQLARLRPAKDVLPDLAANADAYRKKMGRPKSESPKISTTLRLDADVLHELKAGGRGWQTRANALLRTALLEK